MQLPLRHIVFEVTQECNLSCLYCYNHWRRSGHVPRQTSLKQTQQSLNRLLEKIHFEHITFTGGEPFLAEGLKEFVLKCRMKGKGVTIISNGTIATREDYTLLSGMGVSLFEFPLHAERPDIHDTLTGKAGSFQSVLESIKSLSELNTAVCIVCVLTKQNIEHLQQTLEFASALGIKRFMIARFNIGGRGIENTETLLPSLSALRKAFRIANDFALATKMSISANVCLPHCIIDPKDYPNIPISSCGSDFTKRPITIDSLGNIRMCNHSPVVFGNIHSECMNSVFASEYVKSWQTTCPEYCSNCVQWKMCGGGCRAASEQMGKSVGCEDPIIRFFNCENEKEGPAWPQGN